MGGNIVDLLAPIIDLPAVSQTLFILLWCAQTHGILLVWKSAVSIPMTRLACPSPPTALAMKGSSGAQQAMLRKNSGKICERIVATKHVSHGKTLRRDMRDRQDK
jgi:hypothetical protein